jgi:hypothetical protein
MARQPHNAIARKTKVCLNMALILQLRRRFDKPRFGSIFIRHPAEGPCVSPAPELSWGREAQVFWTLNAR